MLEQRAFERYETEIALWARPFGHSGDFIMVETANIGGGGLLMKMDSPLETGAWLDLRFELPQSEDLVNTVVLVKHVIRAEDIFMIGVQFIEVRNFSIPVLMTYLESTCKSGS